MTETFKVGDKVKHNIRGAAEVAYGPYTDTFGRKHSVIRLESGRETNVPTDTLTALPAFAVGDKALCDGKEVSVLAGPFTNKYHTWYVVDMPDVGHTTGSETDLKALSTKEPVKVGDRVRVTDDDGGGANRFNGLVGIVKRSTPGASLPYLVEFGDGRGSHGALNGRWNCKDVEKVDADTFEHDGVTYSYGVRYIDKDGDAWIFNAPHDGEAEPRSAVGSYRAHERLSYVVDNYSPLRRV